jgi:Ca2+-binding EF-hand superfamily protein
MLSSTEIKALWNHFDRNKDGVITKDEFFEFVSLNLKRLYSLEDPVPDELVDEAFIMLDTNHGGSIDYEEFKANINTYWGKKDDLVWKFFTKDKNGKITRKPEPAHEVNFAKEMAAKDALISKLQNEIADLRSKLLAANDIITSLEQEILKRKAEDLQRLERHEKEMNEDLTIANAEIARLHLERASLNKFLEELQKSFALLDEDKKKLVKVSDEKAADSKQKVAELEMEVDRLRDSLSKSSREADTMGKEIRQKYLNEISSLNAEISKLRAGHQQELVEREAIKQRELKGKDDEIAELIRSTESRIQEESISGLQEIALVKEGLSEKDLEISNLNQQLDRLSQESAQLRLELNTHLVLNEQYENLKFELLGISTLNKSLKSENQRLLAENHKLNLDSVELERSYRNHESLKLELLHIKTEFSAFKDQFFRYKASLKEKWRVEERKILTLIEIARSSGDFSSDRTNVTLDTAKEVCNNLLLEMDSLWEKPQRSFPSVNGPCKNEKSQNTRNSDNMSSLFLETLKTRYGGNMQTAFDAMDLNGSGKVTLHEIESMADRLKLPREHGTHFFNERQGINKKHGYLTINELIL